MNKDGKGVKVRIFFSVVEGAQNSFLSSEDYGKNEHRDTYFTEDLLMNNFGRTLQPSTSMMSNIASLKKHFPIH